MHWEEQSLWICAFLLIVATMVALAMGPDRRDTLRHYLHEAMTPTVVDLGDLPHDRSEAQAPQDEFLLSGRPQWLPGIIARPDVFCTTLFR